LAIGAGVHVDDEQADARGDRTEPGADVSAAPATQPSLNPRSTPTSG